MQNMLITLKPLEEQFLAAYAQQFSPAVRSVLHVESVDQELTYVRTCLEQQKQGNTFFYGIFDAETQGLIGALEIRSASTSRGQLYTWINEQYWGKGHFQQALHMAAQQYFAATGALYFDAHVDSTNMRSYKALKKAGFADLGYSDGPYGKQFVVVMRNKNFKFNR